MGGKLGAFLLKAEKHFIHYYQIMGSSKLIGTSQRVLSLKLKTRLGPPPMYKVILLNDDYTPMAFVVEVLKQFFLMSEDRAVQVMFQIHYQGRAVCGVYTKDIAETKVAQVNEFSQIHQHPLLCILEAL